MTEEIEDPGTSVDHIADDQHQLEEMAKQKSGEDVALDPDWIDVKQFETSPTVRAVLLRKHGTGGVARVNASPSRYTLTNKLTGIVLVAAKPGENIVLLGYPSVRYFRRRTL
ncbi:hypothetical protein CIRG_09905 [Coccidioides immitis RMSCC 2394]|uniref:Uncharacterized protein n=1 Tax=Coccidioides immitis RMSCC 2394 TaxID=404692 RepID=A0A0J6YSF1_COCIT|nr:hypothetical protein CIRG_09905 [Coccidioides immitis RMSCC 2394]